MRFSFYYILLRPWEECRLCVLGIATLRQDDWLEIELDLYFAGMGVRIWRRNS